MDNFHFNLAKKILKRMTSKITDVALFRGIPITDKDWSKEDLIMICSLFAKEMKKYQNNYFSALRG